MQYTSINQVQGLIQKLTQQNFDDLLYRLLNPTAELPQQELLLDQALQMVEDFDEAQKFLSVSLHLPRAQNVKNILDMFAIMGVNDLKEVVQQLKPTPPQMPEAPQTSTQEEEILQAYAVAVKKILALSEDMSEEELTKCLYKLNDWEKRLPLSVSQKPASPKVQQLLSQVKQEARLTEKVLKRELVERGAEVPSVLAPKNKNPALLHKNRNKAPNVPAPKVKVFGVF